MSKEYEFLIIKLYLKQFTPSAKIRNSKKYSIVSDYLGTPYQVYNDQGELIWEVELDIYEGGAFKKR